LCDKDPATGNAITTNAIPKAGASFTTLCTLLESGPWTTNFGQIDLIDFIGTDANEHTIFAPTDAAFAEIQGVVDAVLALQTSNPVQFDNIVSNWLQLHVLPDTFLAGDFICDDTYDTLNLSGNARNLQMQKTKCRGQANTFTQIGGGNVGSTDQPTVGLPAGIFNVDNFNNIDNFPTTTVDGTISSNVIGCNGVIHVVDSVLRPGGLISPYNEYYSYYGAKGGNYGAKGGNYGAKGYGTKAYGKGKAGKGDKTAKYELVFNRLLEENTPADTDPETDRENRRARLEALLVDANGNIDSLN